jgi:hypothetical protein
MDDSSGSFLTSSPLKTKSQSPNCAAYFFKHQHHHPAEVETGSGEAAAAAACCPPNEDINLASNELGHSDDVQDLVLRADELVLQLPRATSPSTLHKSELENSTKILDSRDASGEDCSSSSGNSSVAGGSVAGGVSDEDAEMSCVDGGGADGGGGCEEGGNDVDNNCSDDDDGSTCSHDMTLTMTSSSTSCGGGGGGAGEKAIDEREKDTVDNDLNEKTNKAAVEAFEDNVPAVMAAATNPAARKTKSRKIQRKKPTPAGGPAIIRGARENPCLDSFLNITSQTIASNEQGGSATDVSGAELSEYWDQVRLFSC